MKGIIIICCVCLILTISCGKKGNPTLKVYEKPFSPANITSFHRHDGIYLFWQYPVQESQKIKGCQVLKSVDGGVNFKELVFLNPQELSYTDRDFTVGNNYYYKLRCLSHRGVLSDASEIIKISPVKPPEKPREILSTIKNDSIEIRWQIHPEAKANIYKTFEKGSYSLYPINSKPLSDNIFIDKLEPSRIVYYTVRPLWGTQIRDEGISSDEIEVNPAFFMPSSPSGLTYAYAQEKIYLLWKENPENWVKGYRVYKKSNPEEEFILIAETSIPVIVDAAPFASTTLFYYVTALGPFAQSAPSEIIEAITVQDD